MEIEYGSLWDSKTGPSHSIFIGMPFRYYETGTKYFTLLIDGDGRSKLLPEDFIREHYKQKEKQK